MAALDGKISLTITWDVFELPIVHDQIVEKRGLTITWDVFECF